MRKTVMDFYGYNVRLSYEGNGMMFQASIRFGGFPDEELAKNWFVDFLRHVRKSEGMFRSKKSSEHFAFIDADLICVKKGTSRKDLLIMKMVDVKSLQDLGQYIQGGRLRDSLLERAVAKESVQIEGARLN